MASNARAVAEELDRIQTMRRWRRNGAIAGGVVGGILCILLLVRLRGGGGGSGRPNVRLSSTGLTVNGRPSNVGDALLACRDAGGCNVVVTGDARQGDWEILLGALVRARIPIYIH